MNSKIFNGQKFDPVSFLKVLIAIPSFSREEGQTAVLLESLFKENNIPVNRIENNVWVVNKYFDKKKETLLLNSHHDTVKPNSGCTFGPFEAIEKDGKLFGLGSNDAGGALVSLLAVFLDFCEEELPFNILFAASAEEEISGKNGMELFLNYLPKIKMAIVGEPTLMKMAVAEKGLLVLDCKAAGKAGHAARDEGENAIYKAMKDVDWLQNFEFEKVSPLLGPVRMAVTSIETNNKAHNVVPAECNFVVDIRVNELYSFDEILEIIRENISSKIQPRSKRLKPSFISADHSLVKAGEKTGLVSYGSPTCSDMALMDFPAIKLGPGDSARSHMADEYIFIEEIYSGIRIYRMLINNLCDSF